MMNIEEFKRNCSVGDYLEGFTTGKEVRITAIGETRFLYIDRLGRECVSKIQNVAANWNKVYSRNKSNNEASQEADKIEG